MISYRDMTFCISACENRECVRKFSVDVREDAQKWWGGYDAPIALADFAESCEDYQSLYLEEE